MEPADKNVAGNNTMISLFYAASCSVLLEYALNAIHMHVKRAVLKPVDGDHYKNNFPFRGSHLSGISVIRMHKISLGNTTLCLCYIFRAGCVHN